MTTTFDATLTLTPQLLAGTPLLSRPREAVEAVREAVERLRGAAWVDVEWWAGATEPLPLVRRVMVRGAGEDDVEEALKEVVEMVARRALKVNAETLRYELPSTRD